MKTIQITPSVRRCEELARQAKPPAPPSLQTLGQQGRWGRRFRLPGRQEATFFTASQLDFIHFLTALTTRVGTGNVAAASPVRRCSRHTARCSDVMHVTTGVRVFAYGLDCHT